MKKKYLTEDKFDKWVENHFKHLAKDVRWHNRKLNFILALVGFTLAFVGIGFTIVSLLVLFIK